MKVEDIVKLEVPVIQDGVLNSQYGANISFLDGSIFPITATVKDLRSASNILRDREIGLDYIVYYDITWGNSGRSHSILTNIERENTGRHLLTLLLIPAGYKNFKKDLERSGAIVVERDVGKFISESDIEKIIGAELAKKGIDWPNAIVRSVSNGLYEGQGYSRLGEEVSRQIPDVGKIFVPYGGGEIAIGVFNYFRKKYELGEIARMPTIVLAQLNNKKRIRGKNLTEDKTRTKYVTFEDKISGLEKTGQIEVIKVSERERDTEYEFLRQHGIRVEKTSALAFAGARKYRLNVNDNVVIINSGEGRSYEKKLPSRLYESSLARVAASAVLALGFLYGYQHHESSVQQRMEQEFSRRLTVAYGPSRIFSPSIGDAVIEEREAFLHGTVDKPFWSSEKYLNQVAQDGLEFRKSLGFRFTKPL